MDNLYNRGIVMISVMGIIFLCFVFRLFFIQIINPEYRGKADRNVIKKKIIIPPRGNIYDRNNKIFVSNNPVFELVVTPMKLKIPDSTILYKYLNFNHETLNDAIAKATRYSRYKESVIAQHIEPHIYGPLYEQIWNFSGLDFHTKTKRYYRDSVGASFLGYIGEVDSGEIRRGLREGLEYRMGDVIGKSGIERSYDKLLRGKPGVKVVLKDVHNREVGSYLEGKYDTRTEKGADIMLGIDKELQKYGEAIMKNKKGSIVALEPSTGEILAFISAPSYDPNQLSGKESRNNWLNLVRDTLDPLFIRPIQAAYPPGSIFKVASGLAALNEGVISESTRYGCGGGFGRNRGKPRCRFHMSPLGFQDAIRLSCNSYFAATYVDFLHNDKYEDIYEGYSKWRDYLLAMGLGQKLSIDIPYEKPGLIPPTKYYDNENRWYGKNRWNAMTVISNSIGQGEILMTPLQMANLATIIANRGSYVKPHFVRAERKEDDTYWQRINFEKITVPIKKAHFETVVDAMGKVVASGTAGRARIKDVEVCGKTGTVQNPHGKNHAVFIGFAPKDQPEIAIAVVIENSGGGGTWAAPTAGILMEKYLNGEVVHKKYEEKRLFTANFIQ